MVDKGAYMPKELIKDELFLLIITKKKNRDALLVFCEKYDIPILYPSLFKEKRLHNLWGISSSGVGLVSTIVARNISKNHIAYSVKELETKIVRQK